MDISNQALINYGFGKNVTLPLAYTSYYSVTFGRDVDNGYGFYSLKTKTLNNFEYIGRTSTGDSTSVSTFYIAIGY